MRFFKGIIKSFTGEQASGTEKEDYRFHLGALKLRDPSFIPILVEKALKFFIQFAVKYEIEVKN